MNHPVRCEFERKLSCFNQYEYTIRITSPINEMYATVIRIPINSQTIEELVRIGMIQVGVKEITFTDKKFTFSITEGLKPIE